MTQVDNCYYTFRKPINYQLSTSLTSADTFPYTTTSMELIAQQAAKSLETQIFNQERNNLLAHNKRIILGSNCYSNFTGGPQDYTAKSKPYTDITLNTYKTSKYIKSIYHEQATFLTFRPHCEGAWNYLPSYKLSKLGSYNEKPVISHYSHLLYNQFDSVPVFESSGPKDAYLNAIAIHISYEASSSLRFHETTYLHGDQSVKTDSKELLFSTLWNNGESPFSFEDSQEVIQTVSACSGNKYEFKLTRLTAKQLNKNSGAFIPVLVPVQYMSPHVAETVDAYFFTFYYNLPVSKITKYSKPKKYIKDFLKECFTTFGTSFYDKDYAAKIKAYNLKDYADSGYPPSIAKLFQDNNLDLTCIIDSPLNPSIPSENYPSFFSRLKLPDSFLKRQQKFAVKEEKYTAHLNEKAREFKDSLTNIYNLKFKERRILKSIKDAEAQISHLKESLAQLRSSTSDYESSKNFLEYVDAFLNVAPVLKERREDIQLEKKALLSSSTTSVDQTYINLMKKFDLHSIVLTDASGADTIYDSSNLNFSLDLIKNAEIRSVTFSTKEPSRIKVSGSGREEVVGGPYLVYATKHRLSVSLKDKTSWFGWNANFAISDTTPVYIHPHASSTRLSAAYKYNASACLGEASSMLYKAFENKSLKEIFMVANIWLCSANKTDVWGKNYKYFTPYQTYLESLNLETISPEELEDFEYPSQDYLTFVPQPGVASSDTFSSSPPPEPKSVGGVPLSTYQPYSTISVQNESES